MAGEISRRPLAQRRLFGSSGIRQPFSPALLELALRVGAALSQTASGVVLGRDTRASSPALASALAAGLMAGGARVLEGGIAPTPSIGYSARFADLGCVCTASHNPEEYNGIKVCNSDGSSFSPEQQELLEGALDAPPLKDWREQGSMHEFDAIGPHREAVLDLAGSLSGLTVVVDCGNGAGSLLTPHLLSDLGARVIAVNSNPSRFWGRPSEPQQEHLQHLGVLVREVGADLGIAHDGDADRIVACDRRGIFIPGDLLLLLFARHLGARRIVSTYDATMALEEIAEVRRVPVGDAFVSCALREWGDFGGEASGAIIFPRLSLCPDGVHAAALLCGIASERDLAEELASLPRYPLLRESFHIPNSDEILRSLGASEPVEGIRVQEEDGWCLIRASGTEPKIRITAEGRTEEAARRMMERGRGMVREPLNSRGGE